MTSFPIGERARLAFYASLSRTDGPLAIADFKLSEELRRGAAQFAREGACAPQKVRRQARMSSPHICESGVPGSWFELRLSTASANVSNVKIGIGG